VTRCIRAALARIWDKPVSVVIAGPDALSYADFARAVATAAGLPAPRIMPFPAAPLILSARLAQFIPGLPTVRAEEIRRLMENKAFDIAPMRALLEIDPLPLTKGLARTFM
jgi:nucleoside-diphosphate-sugar epimerase